MAHGGAKKEGGAPVRFTRGADAVGGVGGDLARPLFGPWPGFPFLRDASRPVGYPQLSAAWLPLLRDAAVQCGATGGPWQQGGPFLADAQLCPLDTGPSFGPPSRLSLCAAHLDGVEELAAGHHLGKGAGGGTRHQIAAQR